MSTFRFRMAFFGAFLIPFGSFDAFRTSFPVRVVDSSSRW